LPSFLLTIDVEDWFQVENLRPWIPFSTWDSRELRVEANVHKLLDLFDGVKLESGNEKFKARSSNLEGRNSFAPSFDSMDSTDSKDPKDSIDSNPPPITIKVRGTFFVLGWIAKRLPHLVREIAKRGHEVASHGQSHRMCNGLAESDLYNELGDSKHLLEDITGTEVAGFRAPNFSVDDRVLSALQKSGYRYDSSYNNFSLHGRYGQIRLNGNRCGIAHELSSDFFELPISNLPFLSVPMLGAFSFRQFRSGFATSDYARGQGAGRFESAAYTAVCEHCERPATPPSGVRRGYETTYRHFPLPWGGGAYFRLMPLSIFAMGVRFILRKEGAYIFYMHPWEIDFGQPKVKQASPGSRFKHYKNIATTEAKLKRLIGRFADCRFVACKDYVNDGARLTVQGK
jgi:peptidoglycan-N-acetylglucosamine deacetylase